MKTSAFSKKLFSPYLALLPAMAGLVLGSAKWTFFPGPWIGLAFLLFFFRSVSWKKGLVWGVVAIYLANFIGLTEVFPAPLPILAVILLIAALKSVLPYAIDKMARARERGLAGTLIFPSALVSLEYLNTFDSGDVWSSVANTQYAFLEIQQIASVFGIWGITFLMGWMASLLNWMHFHHWKWDRIRIGSLVAASVYAGVLAFGFLRLAKDPFQSVKTVKVAGITRNTSNILETVYEESFGQAIQIPANASQTDPALQEANRAMPAFIEDPYKPEYTESRAALNSNLDALFDKSAEAAKKGARVIAWSEAIGLILATQEKDVLERAMAFAEDSGVYFFLSLGVIQPGPLSPDRVVLINKTVSITPEGGIADTYLKSNPVPFAEQEYGSDDIIPVLDTPYGRLSPVICYDADFPRFMNQLGRLDTDILLVPSGDWKAIDPYHPYMARLRAIEHGVSMVRPVSRATSLISDPNGEILAFDDFFDAGASGIVLADVPVEGMVTFYEKIGDFFAQLCLGVVFYFLAATLLARMGSRRQREHGILKGRVG